MQNNQLIYDFEISWYTKNKMKSFFKKIGESFGFVIILMPIFGIILSIGNAANIEILKKIGIILFSNIGLWFTLAIIIGFTSNKGAAVYAGVLSFLVVNVFISASIKMQSGNLFDVWFWKDLQKSAYLSNLFFGGIWTFNSGVIGGILIGVYVTFIYNRFKDTNLPKGLEFFSKEKLVIIISVLASLVAASLFIIIWPIIGYILSAIGTGVAKSPTGLDSFIFRTIQRMLIPFGSSLLWQSPMWYTQIGGTLTEYQQLLLIEYLYRTTAANDINLIDSLASISNNVFGQEEIISLFKNTLGDKNFAILEPNIEIWFTNTAEIFAANPGGDQIIWNYVSTSNFVTVDDCWNAGLRISRFISGGYVNSIFVLPTLCIVMFLINPKGERKEKIGVYLTAALTAMLVGVTEPVEFLFCYTMPLFYFLIYCPFNGIVAMTTSLFKVKVGTSFSTGIFDFTLSGIIPTINGVNTRIWMIPIIGFFSSILIFLIAFFWFKYFNNKEKLINVSAKNLKANLQLLIDDLGGYKNIKTYNLKPEKLEIEFNKNPDFVRLFNQFNKIEKKEIKFLFEVNDSKKETFELLDLVIKNKQNKIKRS